MFLQLGTKPMFPRHLALSLHLSLGVRRVVMAGVVPLR